MRGDIANVAPDWRSAESYLATVDDHGRLTLLTRGYRQAELREEPGEAALQASLAEAAALEVDHVVYDARTDSHELHLRPTELLAKLLPTALEDALVAAVAASRVERPFVVELFPGPDDDEFQPFARVGGERFRERMVALSPTPEAAVDVLYDVEPPDGATIELVDISTRTPPRRAGRSRRRSRPAASPTSTTAVARAPCSGSSAASSSCGSIVAPGPMLARRSWCSFTSGSNTLKSTPTRWPPRRSAQSGSRPSGHRCNRPGRPSRRPPTPPAVAPPSRRCSSSGD